MNQAPAEQWTLTYSVKEAGVRQPRVHIWPASDEAAARAHLRSLSVLLSLSAACVVAAHLDPPAGQGERIKLR